MSCTQSEGVEFPGPSGFPHHGTPHPPIPASQTSHSLPPPGLPHAGPSLEWPLLFVYLDNTYPLLRPRLSPPL